MNIVKILREEAGLSINELARQTGLSRHTLYSVEDGSREPEWVTLKKIAKAFDRQPADLLSVYSPALSANSGTRRGRPPIEREV